MLIDRTKKYNVKELVNISSILMPGFQIYGFIFLNHSLGLRGLNGPGHV